MMLQWAWTLNRTAVDLIRASLHISATHCF